MKLTDEQIAEVADLLECGLLCYYHRPTGKIEYHPDPDYSDPEPYQDLMDKIEADWDNYHQFEQVDSQQGFKIMLGFAESLSDEGFRDKLLNVLARPKPFRHFNALIHSSEYRQDWFSFKKNAYLDWVKMQIQSK